MYCNEITVSHLLVLYNVALTRDLSAFTDVQQVPGANRAAKLLHSSRLHREKSAKMRNGRRGTRRNNVHLYAFGANYRARRVSLILSLRVQDEDNLQSLSKRNVFVSSGK